jgi:hypothetical protein
MRVVGFDVLSDVTYNVVTLSCQRSVKEYKSLSHNLTKLPLFDG